MSVPTSLPAASATPAASSPEDDARRDALAGRLFEATLGAFDLLAIHLGTDLGLYASLRADGTATPIELAERTGIHTRYAREWLEHQAVAGILDVDDPAAEPDARRYALPAAHADVLLDPDHLATMAPMPRFVMAATRAWPALLEAYRSGGGVDWNEYPLISEAQEAANRPLFQQLLGQEWLPSIPDVHQRLLAGGARVADVASGAGWSSVAMAIAYPGIEVTGLDLDAEAVARATSIRGRGRRLGPRDVPCRRRRRPQPRRAVRPRHDLRGRPRPLASGGGPDGRAPPAPGRVARRSSWTRRSPSSSPPLVTRSSG